jgi:formylglycine-generating enzyme required for sulfatase activity
MNTFQALTRWLTPWRTIRRLEAENQRLREQAVLGAAINQELSILAESRRLKIEALASPAYRLRKCPTHGQQPPNAWGCPECVWELRGELVTHQSITAEPTATAAARSPAGLISMVQIPAGRFLMGSPEDEPGRLDHEGPQHEVTLGAFFMAKTPITQAQWREVASWPRVERDLDPDPSYFKGDNRPVEQVSWHDAMEFCHRLSQRTGKNYTLPSEAQWEYACRAGTTIPFHFRPTISTDVANYDGNYIYGYGQDSKGTYRQQTTDVASFPANAWGLHDMHGNVWEWCLDKWHANYNGAPTDGSVWVEDVEGEKNKELEKIRLLRGGSWGSYPRYCRSAFRYGSRPVDRYFNIGFRVCCLPQD